MKICPTCQNRYTDDTLQFCLQDGTPLVSEESQNSTPTVIFEGEPETVVRPRQTEISQVEPINPQQEQQTWERQKSEGDAYQTAPRKSNTALIVLATVLATLLLLGIGGIGTWLYFANKRESAKNSNVKSSFPDNSAKNANENSSAFPSANASPKPSAKPSIESKTPAPNVDPEKIEDEVKDTVDSWIDQIESRDLSAYMNNYADTVDYYNKKNVSAAAVRADKQRAFSAYDTIEMKVSNVRVMPDSSGETATAVFDKEWYFENDAKSSEGKVQSQLQFRKIGGAWKITSERDLKVYYVR